MASPGAARPLCRDTRPSLTCTPPAPAPPLPQRLWPQMHLQSPELHAPPAYLQPGSSGHGSPGSGMPLWPVQTAMVQARPACSSLTGHTGRARPQPRPTLLPQPWPLSRPCPASAHPGVRPAASRRLSQTVSAGSCSRSAEVLAPACPGTDPQLAVTQPGRRGQEPVLSPSVNGPLAKTPARGHTLLQGRPVPHSPPARPLHPISCCGQCQSLGLSPSAFALEVTPRSGHCWPSSE